MSTIFPLTFLALATLAICSFVHSFAPPKPLTSTWHSTPQKFEKSPPWTILDLSVPSAVRLVAQDGTTCQGNVSVLGLDYFGQLSIAFPQSSPPICQTFSGSYAYSRLRTIDHDNDLYLCHNQCYTLTY
jgi:hypothetical protein